MMNKLDKLMEKKGKKLSPIEQRAKSDVLSKLRGEASDAMGEKLGGLQKVSVAAPDKQGLEKGLAKAKELLGGMSEDEQEDPEHELMEGQEPESEEEQYKDCSPEELQEKIDMLMKLKEQKMSQGQE